MRRRPTDRLRRLLLLCAAGLLLLVAPARSDAQLAFELTPAVLTGAPGSSVNFTGTLTNTGTSLLFLNGVTHTLTGAGLTLDDTPFFDNTPPSLAGGASFSGALFGVAIAPAALPGTYSGSFTIRGGLTASAQDALASQNFQVIVSSASSAVPEPATLLLFAAAAAPPLLRLTFRRRLGR